QMETPEQAKARKAPTIRRDITRLVTAGTVTEETLLEAARPAWLLALAPMEDRIGAAWLDVSTGAFGTESLPRGEIQALLARLEPAEILAPDGVFEGEEAARITPADPPRDAARRLAEAFDVSTLDGFGSFSVEELAAAAMALDYVRATQAGALPRLAPPSPMGGRGLLQMDAATRRSLEILKSERGRRGIPCLLPWTAP
ncbi:MAG: DNA mismatch repair protein MutS, partial [Acetobacteraceae bacterium]|nr:DNA mismatch repair protein MutS [Acetobacteraceae bacterium]